MIHPRMSKKKILKIMSVFNVLVHGDKTENPIGSSSDNIRYVQQQERYQKILKKIENGLDTKEYPFDKDEARELVIGLDLYNVITTDNKTGHWDPDVEALYHELKKRFSSIYNEALYENESPDRSL